MSSFEEEVAHDEAAHTAAISRIAERVAARAPVVRLILLSGPSSAGKTTTAIRLKKALEAEGLCVCRLSTDDYFVGNSRNPRNPDGSFDYETVKAVDNVRLSEDLSRLFWGERVRLRRFDFIRHEGYDDRHETSLARGGVVVLEGIHALNPILTDGVDELLKFRVYLNVLTSPAGIRPEEVRLLRRIVRDNTHRGTGPAATLADWPQVMAGEVRWINPTRRHADAVFNTALDYEPHVMRGFVLPLLSTVASDDPNFGEVQRLSGFLEGIEGEKSDCVPGDSILRETIGGSTLDYTS